MYRHILIPTDGSELADHGVAHGLALAKSLGAKVSVIFVVEPFSEITGRFLEAVATYAELRRVVQNAPAPAAETARVPHRLAQKHRQVRAAGNARAEMRAQKLRKQVRRVQAAPAERRPPLQDARAQAQPAQNAQAPALFPTFGFGN